MVRDTDKALDRFITFEGSAYALFAGAVVGTGWTLMTDSTPDDKIEVLAKRVARRAFGTSLFVFGLYLWSPTWLRQAWSAKKLVGAYMLLRQVKIPNTNMTCIEFKTDKVIHVPAVQ